MTARARAHTRGDCEGSGGGGHLWKAMEGNRARVASRGYLECVMCQWWSQENQRRRQDIRRWIRGDERRGDVAMLRHIEELRRDHSPENDTKEHLFVARVVRSGLLKLDWRWIFYETMDYMRGDPWWQQVRRRQRAYLESPSRRAELESESVRELSLAYERMAEADEREYALAPEVREIEMGIIRTRPVLDATHITHDITVIDDMFDLTELFEP